MVSNYTIIKNKENLNIFLCLIIQAMVTGVFCATDSVLFYIFFEAMLIPMYVFIGVLGGEKRQSQQLSFSYSHLQDHYYCY